jgi:hypothetical protein
MIVGAACWRAPVGHRTLVYLDQSTLSDLATSRGKTPELETAARDEDAAVSWRRFCDVALWSGAVFSVSVGSDGECVGVVGEDRPAGPDLLALLAFQSAAVEAVAAFEVADSAFGAGAVAGEASLSAS